MVTWFTPWQDGKYFVKEYIMYNFPLTTLILTEPSFTIIIFFNYVLLGFKYILLFSILEKWEGVWHFLHICIARFLRLLFIRTDVDIIYYQQQYYHYYLPSSIKLPPLLWVAGKICNPSDIPQDLYILRLRGPLRTSRASVCMSTYISFTIPELPTLNFTCSLRHTRESFKMNDSTVYNT